MSKDIYNDLLKGKYKVLQFQNAFVGMRVVDPDDDFGVGTITQIDDSHNIFVEFDNGGTGFHCLNEKCRYYDPIYTLELPNFD